MKILTIIPIAKGIPRDELSYFSAKPVELGTFVTVPFGKRSIKGVVIDQQEVRDLKSSIKSSSFALKNISIVHPETMPSALFSAGQITAHFYAQPTGPVLKTMVSDTLFDYYLNRQVSATPKRTIGADIQALQMPTSERYSYYRTLVRENLARHMSTLVIVPTVAQAESFYASLRVGTEDATFILHSRKTKKHLLTVIPKILASSSPVTVIATAPYAALIRPDWESIVIESSSSSHYRYSFGPVFDMRLFVAEFAKACDARLIYADTLLSLDVRSDIASRAIIDARSTWHIAKPRDMTVVDMKKSSFQVLHEKTLQMIELAHAEQQQILLLTTRKGLAPITICSDCGTAVSCPVCETPLVLHRKASVGNPDARIYLCHHCMHVTEPQDHCMKCDSWKLKTLGISTDSIRDAIHDTLPRVQTFICDGDHATTPAAVQKIIQAWHQTPGSVLVATPFVLPYIDTVPYGAIVSMDSLLSLPAYSAGEHALHVILGFLERVSSEALLQTRNYDNSVIQAIVNENLFDAVREELAARKQFGYPPEKVLIKISSEIRKAQAKEASEYLESVLKPFDPDLLIKRAAKADAVIVQALLKVSPVDWKHPDNELRHVMGLLGPEWKKEVNSDSVL
jgi:primosomal protein N'